MKFLCPFLKKSVTIIIRKRFHESDFLKGDDFHGHHRDVYGIGNTHTVFVYSSK